MLTLLAGPIDITPLDPLDEVVLAQVGIGMWRDDRGLYFVSAAGSTNVGNVYVVHVNGQAARVGGTRLVSCSGIGWSAEDRLPTVANNAGHWSKGTLPACGVIGDIHNYGPSYAVMADRRLVYSANWVKNYPYDATTPENIEYTFSSPLSGGFPAMLMYAGKENDAHLWWGLTGDTGNLQKYDATNRTIAPGLNKTSIGPNVRTAGYSIKHRVFVAIRHNSDTGLDQLYVYGADDPAAATLSAVERLPAARRGGMSVLRTRVLGDKGEPCAGRNVRFAVTVGSVEQEVVATDASGYATVRFFAPPGSGSLAANATATLEE